MRIARKRPTGLMVLALTAALLAAALVGCSGGDEKAMVQAGGDFVVALVTADGEAVLALVPDSIAEEHPEYADAKPLVDGFTITQEWDGDALVLSAEADGELMEEAYRLSAGGTDNTVTMLVDGETVELTMEETDDGWIVTQLDGEPVDDLLATMLLTSGMDEGGELDAETETLLCHGEQTIWELAALTFVAEGEPVPTDPDAYVPELVDEITYCPSSDSQYSAEQSTNGYLDGMGEDGVLEPCSVHGSASDE